MKDYSFGDNEYRKKFILKYVKKDGKIILYFADGHKDVKEDTISNMREILTTMKQQIYVAHEKLHNETLTYKNIKQLLVYMKIQSKRKDIEKNKLFIDNLDVMNQALNFDKRWAASRNFSLYLQDRLIWRKSPLTINSADKFKLDEVKDILDEIEDYYKRHQCYIGYPEISIKR